MHYIRKITDPKHKKTIRVIFLPSRANGSEYINQQRLHSRPPMYKFDVAAFDIRDAKLGSANETSANDHAVFECNLYPDGPGNKFIDMGPHCLSAVRTCHIFSRNTPANTFQAHALADGGLLVQSNYNIAVLIPRRSDILIQTMSAPHMGSHSLKFMKPSERLKIGAGSILLVTKDPTISVQMSDLDKAVLVSNGNGTHTKFPSTFWETTLCLLHDSLIDMWANVRKLTFDKQAFNERVVTIARIPSGCPMAEFFNTPLLMAGKAARPEGVAMPGGAAAAPSMAQIIFGVKQFQETVVGLSKYNVQNIGRQQYKSHVLSRSLSFVESICPLIAHIKPNIADDTYLALKLDVKNAVAQFKDIAGKGDLTDMMKADFERVTNEFIATMFGRLKPATVEEKDAATALLSLTGKRGGEGGGGGGGKKPRD